MSTIYTASALTALIILVVYITHFNWRRFFTSPELSLIFIGFVVRLLALRLEAGYEADLNCFKSWSNMLFERGLGNFYISPEFTDYPPGYMYILYIIGALRKLFNLPFNSAAFEFLVKFPAMFCDIVTSIVIYYFASKYFKKLTAWLIASAYVINPAIIINSTVWGQVDAVYTLILLISVYFIAEKKYSKGFYLFAFAVLVKPQALIFSPVYLIVAYEILNEGEFTKAAFVKLAKYFFVCVGILLVFIFPFALRYDNGFILDFKPVFKQYSETIGSYPYATLNAYNFFAFVGANWRHVAESFLFLNYTKWGVIFIDCIIILSFLLLSRNKQKSNYYFVAGLINTLAFMFSMRMHERYLFPSLVFFLMAFIHNKERKIFLLYLFFSVTLFVNCADVINMLMQGNNLSLIAQTLPVLSFANLILTGFMVYTALSAYKKGAALPGFNEDDTQEIIEVGYEEDIAAVNNSFSYDNTDESMARMTKKDYLLLGGLTLIYSILAFVNLGNTKSPQTIWSPGFMETAYVDFGSEQDISRIQFMLGPRENQSFIVQFSEDGVNWEGEDSPYFFNVTGESVFAWKEISIGIKAKSAKIIANIGPLMLQEMAFMDGDKVIEIVGHSETAKNLFDEQGLAPDKPGFKNSTHFDEIYHARTAYEFIHKLPVYEWTHPPLGKVIMSWGIMLFGMTPFGWRFSGTVMGILMIPIMYLFGKKIFKSTLFAFFSAAVFTFDFMHFSQTRIATIDSYPTFFIMTSFYFMYSYYCMNFYETKIWKTLVPLGLSGVFIGLAIASKWPGMYAAAGLAVVFFIALYKRWTEYIQARQHSADDKFSVFPKNALITLASCCLFFIVIPIAIYLLAYIPYLQTPGKNGLESVLSNQSDMLGYHSRLVSTHPFSSEWWKWPFNIRPLLFVNDFAETGKRSAISTFGNPAVWWMGVVAFFYTLSSFSKNYNKTAIFLIVGYLAQILPWTFVSRTTYIYHYFPSVPFVVLLTAYLFRDYAYNKDKKYVYAYICLVFFIFVLFYPVISGLPFSPSFVNTFLKWLPSWQLM